MLIRWARPWIRHSVIRESWVNIMGGNGDSYGDDGARGREHAPEWAVTHITRLLQAPMLTPDGVPTPPVGGRPCHRSPTPCLYTPEGNPRYPKLHPHPISQAHAETEPSSPSACRNTSPQNSLFLSSLDRHKRETGDFHNAGSVSDSMSTTAWPIHCKVLISPVNQGPLRGESEGECIRMEIKYMITH